MKDSALQTYQLSKTKKVLIVSLIFLFEICYLGLIAACYLKGYYAIACIISFWFLVNIITAWQCCISRIVVYPDYCIVRSWIHPGGEKIDWNKVDEIYFRHYSMFNNQRIVIRYHDSKQKEIGVLCDEHDDIEDIIPYLHPNTKVRKY